MVISYTLVRIFSMLKAEVINTPLRLLYVFPLFSWDLELVSLSFSLSLSPSHPHTSPLPLPLSPSLFLFFCSHSFPIPIPGGHKNLWVFLGLAGVRTKTPLNPDLSNWNSRSLVNSMSIRSISRTLQTMRSHFHINRQRFSFVFSISNFTAFATKEAIYLKLIWLLKLIVTKDYFHWQSSYGVISGFSDNERLHKVTGRSRGSYRNFIIQCWGQEEGQLMFLSWACPLNYRYLWRDRIISCYLPLCITLKNENNKFGLSKKTARRKRKMLKQCLHDDLQISKAHIF